MNAHSGTSHKAISKALAHQTAGRLGDAERLFRSVLKSEPHHPAANHGLGVLSVKQGKAKAAIPFLNAAVNANPQEHLYWVSFIETLIEAGAIGDARLVLDKGVALGLSGPLLDALATRLKHSELYQLALQHHKAGRLTEAEQGYTEILQNDPIHAASYHMLGVIAWQTSRLEVAIAFISQAIRLNDTVASFHCSLGNALDGLGRFDEAIESYNKALRFDPNGFDAHNNLGVSLVNKGRRDDALKHFQRAAEIRPEHPAPHNGIGDIFRVKKDSKKAIAYYEKAIRLDPSYVSAYNNMGALLSEVGQPDKAVEWYRRALELDPSCAEAHYNLAISLQELNRLDEALEHLKRAIVLKPNYADAHSNLGNLLQKRGELELAEEHYRQALKFSCAPAVAADAHNNLGNLLQKRGELELAEEHYCQALNLSCDPAVSHVNLGILLSHRGNVTKAIAHFRDAVSLKPDSANAHSRLAEALSALEQYEEAIPHVEEALRLQPDFADAMNALAMIFQKQGKLREATSLYESAIQVRPSEPVYRTNLILAHLYAAEFPVTELVKRAREFDEKLAAPLLRERAFVNVADPDRRLRIGFVSGDFRKHSVSYYFEPLLAHLDRRQFETFAYSSVYIEDDVTARLKDNFSHWRNIRPLDDGAAADVIEADGIDILVDLAGHTAGNRLLVFAHKPAPIQLTWLGFSATTGMRAIDYRITDGYSEPPGMTEHLNVETLWRLPRIAHCYQGAANGPAVIDHPPRDDNGYVTFGCFNNFARVSNVTLAAWAQILARLPDARLMLEISGLESANFRAEVDARLTEAGLPLERVILVPRSAANQFVLYNKIDIALDPFPSNGGATSMDALWMGVPFVALAGDRFSARMGVSFLTNAGLSELIAADEDQYVALAVGLAGDDARLRSVRHDLRERVMASPLMDQALFARDMEDAYRAMWKIWCRQQQQERKLAFTTADIR